MMMALSSNEPKLIAVIGDEDTCVGFLLGGIGEFDRTKALSYNFMVVETRRPDTAELDRLKIESSFSQFIKRDDIVIILISQDIAEQIRWLIDAHKASIPAILEIPSKHHPYDPNKDSIFRRATRLQC